MVIVMLEDDRLPQLLPYLISANGVYRCVTYLLRGKEYNAFRSHGKYSYRAIRATLQTITRTIKPYDDGSQVFNTFDGDYLWEHYFLRDPLLSERIKHQGFTSISQLHHYAIQEAIN